MFNRLGLLLSRPFNEVVRLDSLLSHSDVSESSLESFHLANLLEPGDKVLNSFLESSIKECLESKRESTCQENVSHGDSITN